MAGSSFMPEVKEQETGQPCFVVLNTDEDIGLQKKQIIFDLPNGTGIEDAQAFARSLRGLRVRIA